MIHSGRRAFTLIELLIVVAIIAIMTAGSMTIMTAPMFERLRAADREAYEAGMGAALASLVADAHRASDLDAGTSGTLTFTMPAPAAGTVTYSINSSGTLTRQAAGRSPAHLVAAHTFTAEKQATSPLYLVTIKSNIRGHNGGITPVERRLDVLAGAGLWAGGA